MYVLRKKLEYEVIHHFFAQQIFNFQNVNYIKKFSNIYT